VSPDGYTFQADSGAVWDLTTNGDPIAGRARPAGAALGWTSVDAAGLPVFPGLVTYYEAGVLGVIRHALRFTVQVRACSVCSVRALLF
jgi:hypothetical protein